MGQAGSLKPPIWIRWAAFFLSRFLGCCSACRNWVRGPCTQMKRSMRTSLDNCWPAEPSPTIPRTATVRCWLRLPCRWPECRVQRRFPTSRNRSCACHSAGRNCHDSAFWRGGRNVRLRALPDRRAVVCCAPLPVYYDRYFIHESIFAAATFGLILTGWRACKMPSAVQAASGWRLRRADAGKQRDRHSSFLCAGCAPHSFSGCWNLRGKIPVGLWRPRAVLAAAAVFLLLSVIAIHLVRQQLEGARGVIAGSPEFSCACRRRRPSKAVLVFCPASHRRLVGWIDLRLCLHRVLPDREKACSDSIRFPGVLCAFSYRRLQSDSLQDAVVGPEFLAADCPVRRAGDRVAVAHTGAVSCLAHTYSRWLYPGGGCGCHVDRPRYAAARLCPSCR